MGYTTDFKGSFNITPALKPEHKAYINKFSETRRYKRDAGITEMMADPIRIAAGLPIGVDGGFYVNHNRCDWPYTRDTRNSVVDYNEPPAGQPGLRCQWVANDEGVELSWDGSEKFYNYIEWLEYLINTFLEPWGYALNGEIKWYGEERADIGKIFVVANTVTWSIVL